MRTRADSDADADPVMTSVVDRLRAAGCVFADDEARLLVASAPTPSALESMVASRAAGRPLELVLGWAEFCGLRIVVEPGVFVPRRRTEFLVAQAVSVAPTDAVVVDTCCGSGAVGAAMLAMRPDIALHAADVDAAAVSCARRNLGASGQVYAGDLFDALPARLQGRIDVVVANVPYVPTREIELMPPEARVYEPRVALDGGNDGLDLQRRVAAQAPKWLVPGGHLLIETSERQGAVSLDIFRSNGFTARLASSEELGATVVIGQLPLLSTVR